MVWRAISLAAFLIVLALAGCARQPPPATEKTFDFTGKVLTVDAENKKIRIDHEEIVGCMPAMQMWFKVDDVKVLQGIKSDDNVRGRLKVSDGSNNYIITDLRKL